MIDINKTAEQFVSLMDSEYSCDSEYAKEVILPKLKKRGFDVVKLKSGNWRLVHPKSKF